MKIHLIIKYIYRNFGFVKLQKLDIFSNRRMLLALLVQPKLGENMSLWLKIAAGFRNVNDNHALSPPRVTSSFFIRTIRLSGKYKRENKEYGYSLALPKTKLSLTLRDGAALQREKKIQKVRFMTACLFVFMTIMLFFMLHVYFFVYYMYPV